MSQEEFNQIVNQRLEATKSLLTNKGKEYIRNNDIFHNFNKAADMRGTSPLSALQGFLDKHIVSWLDIVSDVENSDLSKITEKHIEEKIGDIVTYFVIAEALVKKIIKEKNK
jgi:hypothetical protein